MTKTCLQCGAVLSCSARVCNFCDSSLSTELPLIEEPSAIRANSARGSVAAACETGDPAWRSELAQRMEAYRVRRRRLARNTAQSQLPFGDFDEPMGDRGAIAVAQPSPPERDSFSFTIAIGPQSVGGEKAEERIEIDVSGASPTRSTAPQDTSQELSEKYGLYPVASLEERRFAALIDAACFLFAYGGFVALFGSLGGQFTVSKLSAAVYGATIAIVYVQYFALFTIFGGTTPGMMFRGLQVTSFSGDEPTPRQLFVRTLGYVLSAGTLFLGFLWAWWDEDALTWHDRLSRTYLSAPQANAEMEGTAVAHSR